jgi:hypothetical protein
MRKVIFLGIGMILSLGLWLSGARSAQACVNWCEPAVCIDTDPNTFACVKWGHSCCDCEVNNTKCSGQVCPAGKYACNRESDNYCCPIGGGNCPCGEFYACPTANNPNKMCKCCGGEEAACRAGKVDCPAGINGISHKKLFSKKHTAGDGGVSV